MSKDTTKRKWQVSDLARALKNSLLAILKGEFLLRLNVGRYFPHIVYIFFVMSMVIWCSLMIDKSMTGIETNKKVIEELQTRRLQKTCDLAVVSGRGAVKERLKELGSELGEPEGNVTLIEK